MKLQTKIVKQPKNLFPKNDNSPRNYERKEEKNESKPYVMFVFGTVNFLYSVSSVGGDNSFYGGKQDKRA